MNAPKYRNDINGTLPQLKQTVQDICNYLPSLRLESNTLHIEEHRTGTIVNVKPPQAVAANRGSLDKAEAVMPDEFFSSYNQCDIYSANGRYGEHRMSHYEGAGSSFFLEIGKYTANLNGIYATFNRQTFRVTDVADQFFVDNPSLSATDESAIYGSLRLEFYLTSGAVAPSAMSVFDYPPIYYTWNLSASFEWEKLSHFNTSTQTNYSYEFPSRGNYGELTQTGMPASVNSIVGLFKLSGLKSFSDDWHKAGGHLSGMTSPKLDVACKTVDSNPTIFLSFTDDLLNYVHQANSEEPHES